MRKPSAPRVTDTSLLRASEVLGFEPTQAQLRAKAGFWTAYQADPSIAVENLSIHDVVLLVDSPNLKQWWSDSRFRAWFLNKDEWRSQLEYAFLAWLDGAAKRLQGGMTDKDFISLGKLLAELASKIPRVGDAKPSRSEEWAKLPPAELRRKFHEVAMQLGYAPPAELPPAQATAPTAGLLPATEAT
jgi:hypothetical protein